MFAFSLVTLSGTTTYWRRVFELERKKALSNKQNGLIAQHTGEDTSQQQRDTQLQVVKESTTKFQHATNRTRFLLKQLQGIKLYKRQSVSNSGYLKKICG